MQKPKGGTRAIGAYVAKALDPTARARGFATTSLLSDWPAIAGSELARFTMPDRIIWPRRHEDEETPRRGQRTQGATLILKVEGPRAIEVQHRSAQILERVNAYFGYRAVTDMRFLQAPIHRAPIRRATRPAPDAKPPPPAYDLPQSAGIQDEGLARALARLGASVRSRHWRG